MMRYAILSDIHGNWEALDAVVAACHRLGARRFLCVGDTVGYGANPRECLEAHKALGMASVAGNHDWAVGGRLDASYFNEYGKAGVAWCRNHLPLEYFQYLNALELVFRNDDLILVHGSLNHPERFAYLRDISEAADTFYLMDRPVCFIGHTHVPQIFVQRQGRVFYAPGTDIELEPDGKYIVNVGSVGQPRDGNPMAAYAIYDTETRMISLKRTPYDIAMAQHRILQAGLPEFLARRLTVGQ